MLSSSAAPGRDGHFSVYATTQELREVSVKLETINQPVLPQVIYMLVGNAGFCISASCKKQQ